MKKKINHSQNNIEAIVEILSNNALIASLVENKNLHDILKAGMLFIFIFAALYNFHYAFKDLPQ